jgi:hypothetical protein
MEGRSVKELKNLAFATVVVAALSVTINAWKGSSFAQPPSADQPGRYQLINAQWGGEGQRRVMRIDTVTGRTWAWTGGGDLQANHSYWVAINLNPSKLRLLEPV